MLNRRGLFGALIGAPVALVAAATSKTAGGDSNINTWGEVLDKAVFSRRDSEIAGLKVRVPSNYAPVSGDKVAFSGDERDWTVTGTRSLP